MDRSDVCSLLSVTKSQDEFGVWREEITEREVFCSVDSITRAEFFDAGRNGLNPEFRITMFFDDYEGETMLTYNDKSYAVYRTYHAKNDTIELYVERKGGTNGKENSSPDQP